MTANPTQQDSDNDGLGDACDPTSFGEEGGGGLPPVFFGLIPGTTLLSGGGQPQSIDCLNPLTILQLSNRDRAVFSGLCGYEAALTSESQGSVESLGSGVTFLKGMTISVLEDGSPAQVLPGNGQVTVSFVIPPDAQGKSLSILYWDPAANSGAGGWVEVPMVVNGDRAEATVNHGGTFILVMK